MRLPSHPEVGQLLALLGSTCFLAFALFDVYAFHAFGLPGWVWPAVVHTVLAVLVRATAGSAFHPLLVRPFSWVAFLPATVIVITSIGLGVFSGHAQEFAFGQVLAAMAWGDVATWTWIPIVEEIVFRQGVSSYLYSLMPRGWWASYFSAVLFAMMHQGGSDSFAISAGVPLGPLMLGLCCEGLCRVFGRLWPAVLFHASCNLTPALFEATDGRWLQWLGFLYQ